MRFRESLLCGAAFGLAALTAEIGVLWALEPGVPALLRESGDAAWLAVLYASAYSALAVLAWGFGGLMDRFGWGGRTVTCFAVLVAAMVPPILGALAMRPTLERTVEKAPVLAAVAALATALAIALAVTARRASPRIAGTLATALVACALALPAVGVYALQHLPRQLLQLPQIAGLATITGIAAVVAILVARLLPGMLHGERTRRLALLAFASSLVLAGVLGGGGERHELPAADETPPRDLPSILLIVCDTLRADFAFDPSSAPELARFTGDGVRFGMAWSAAPWTLPSFASMLTSTLPRIHRAGARPPGQLLKEPMRSDLETLSGVLGAEGYVTVAALSNATLMPRYGLARDFHEYSDLMHPIRYHPIRRWLDRLLPPSFRHSHRPPYLDAEQQTKRILATFDRARATGRPVFLLGQYMDPHRPFGAPAQDYDEEADDASLEAHYGAEVRYFDRAFGELVEGLRARGVYRDLVIAFTSDHGEELSEARGLPGGPHGHSLHEELLHVPLVLKLPGNAFAGRRIDEPVSLIDLAPTLLGVAGIDAPESFRGTDLLRASPKTLRARTLYAGGLRTVPPQRAARHIGRKVLGRRTDLGDGEQAGWDWTAYDLEEDPLETRPRPLAAPPQWAESLDEEGPQGLSSPAGVEVDPGLRDALEALGYTE